jgi:hypothetical protein
MCSRCSDSNYIHVEPLRSRNTKEFTSAFVRMIKFFRDRDINHLKAKIDNEASNVFKETAKNLGITIEFVPPDNHRTNPVERTLKNHLIASLSTTDADFPINEWDRILPQVEMTLNLLRGSCSRECSSYQHVWGYFNRNPIAPVGTRVVILEDPPGRRL